MKTVIYLALVASAAGDSASCPNGGTLFFSQFQEATSGNNKYYQIYNPKDTAEDLTTFSIGYCCAGCIRAPVGLKAVGNMVRAMSILSRSPPVAPFR